MKSERQFRGSQQVKYHSSLLVALTPEQAGEPCLVGSLTGAVASQRVTEAPKGSLRVDWKSPEERIGIRELDCETYKSSRNESWAK